VLFVTWCELFLLSVLYAFLMWVIWCILFDVLMLSLYLAPAAISITDIIVIATLIFIIWIYLHRTFQASYLCAYIPSEIIVRISQTAIYRTLTYRPWNPVNRTFLSQEIPVYNHIRHSATVSVYKEWRYVGVWFYNSISVFIKIY
jgi:hypothetical protein